MRASARGAQEPTVRSRPETTPQMTRRAPALGTGEEDQAPRTLASTLAMGIAAARTIRDRARERSFRTPPATAYRPNATSWCEVTWAEDAARPTCTVCFAGALIARRWAPTRPGHYTPAHLTPAWARTTELLDALRRGAPDDALMHLHPDITGENADAFAEAIRARTGDRGAPPGTHMRSWGDTERLIDALGRRWLDAITVEEPRALLRRG